MAGDTKAAAKHLRAVPVPDALQQESSASVDYSLRTLTDLPEIPEHAKGLGFGRLAAFPNADSAALFVWSRLRSRLRSVPATQSGPPRQWVLYSGGRWSQIGVDHLTSLIRTALQKEAIPLLAHLESRSALEAIDYVVSVANSNKVLAVVDQLARIPSIRLAPDAVGSLFDRDPNILNVENGTIDLRTGILRPHRAEDWCMKMAPVSYDPSAPAPLWNSLIEKFCVGDRELAAHLQAALGYGVTGLTLAQLLFISSARDLTASRRSSVSFNRSSACRKQATRARCEVKSYSSLRTTRIGIRPRSRISSANA